jgi:hypothetical protein
MILPFRQVRDADPGYALNILLAFVEHFDRNPDDTATLADWWGLPLPLHQRLSVLGGVAATHPEHAPKVLRALQDAAGMLAEKGLGERIKQDDLWTTQCDLIRALIGAKDAGVDLTTATARLDALVAELSGANP